MGLFNIGKGRGASPQELAERARRAEQEASEQASRLESLQELVRHLDEDHEMLLKAAQAFRPGMEPRALGQALLDICFRPLSLASCFMALVDWEADRIQFPIYHEGGRLRNQATRPFTESGGGLTGKAMRARAPLYLHTLEESREAGAIFSEAERVSGLVPQSWYGVPMGIGEGWGDLPFGLVSFQSFQRDAFPESRRRLMDALTAHAALALKTRP